MIAVTSGKSFPKDYFFNKIFIQICIESHFAKYKNAETISEKLENKQSKCQLKLKLNIQF